MPTIRVVLGEDRFLQREGLSRLLAECGETEVVAAVADPRAMVRAVDGLRPDAVLTSLVAPAIRRDHPRVGVVVLRRPDRLALDWLAHGTAGLTWVHEEHVRDFAEVLRALRDAVAGCTTADPVVIEALTRMSGPFCGLTARERDVLEHMAHGWTNRAIAEELAVAESTVEKHVNTAFAKLGLGNDPKRHRRVTAVLAYFQDRVRNVREIPSLPE